MKFRVPKLGLGDRKESIKILFLAQTFLIMMVTLYLCSTKWEMIDERYYFISTDTMLVILLFLSGIVGIGSLCLFNEIEILLEKEKEYEIQKIQITQMQESNDLLKSQKHEFSNNLQVLWGLLSLGNMEKAKEYLGEYSSTLNIDEKELIKLNELPCTYLYTLLINKAYKCQGIGTKINYHIQPSIPLKCFNSIDIVSILGNLLDNAIYETEKLGAGEGSIIVDMYYDEKRCSFRVTNKGTVIPEGIKDKIFEKGFTTKGSEGDGFGLYNVEEIVKKYDGEIYVESDAHIGTSFVVNLPRKGVKKGILSRKATGEI